MNSQFATITLAATVLLMGAACLESDEPKKVEVVDKRSVGTTQNPKAVSDSDFASLTKEVEALKTELSNLKKTTAVKSEVNSELSALGSSISSLNTSVAGLNAAKQPTLWLYDGDGTKRYEVKGFDTQERLQIAIVEVKPGVVARYIINRRASYALNELPLPFSTTNIEIDYSEASCGGTPVLRNASSYGGFGWGGTLGNYFIYLTGDGSGVSNFSYSSYRDQSTGACSNFTGTISGESHQVTVEAKSSYQLKNPLAVGP